MAQITGQAGLKVHSQAANRHTANFADQHDRAHWATVENKSGHPAGVIAPSRGWRAPSGKTPETMWCKGKLNPPQEFLKITDTEHGVKCLVQYDDWLAAWDQADRDRTQMLSDMIAQDGVKHGKSPGQISAEINDPPGEYLKIVGAGPGVKWPREFIVAASRGNHWCLGTSDELPKWAVPILKRWRTMQPVGLRRLDAADDELYPNADEERRMIERDELAKVAAVAAAVAPETPSVPRPTATAPKKKIGRPPKTLQPS